MDGKERLPVEILEALERGAIVITGNQRAARTLRRDLDRRNRERGLRSWQPASVMAWESWTAALWRRLLVNGRSNQLLLNRSQEHAVWQTILEADEELASLKTVDSLAEMAAEAWRLVCSYDGLRRLRGALGGNSDTRSFQRWALTFERTCKAEAFVSQSQLEDGLRGFFQAGEDGGCDRDVVLVGFDAMTPAQIRLIDALRATGVTVSELRLAVEPKTRLLVGTDDAREEIATAARWIRNHLERQPDARVGVVVPGLSKERAEIDRAFREILAPELQDIRAGNESAPYEFSIARPLMETPMVVSALDLLQWAAEALSVERISALLLSPYFAMSREERGARAEFDAFELRRMRMLRPEVSLDVLLGTAERSQRRSRMLRLVAALRRMVIARRRLESKGTRSHAQWAEQIRELLETADWSAPRQSSFEFQTRRKWESALDEMTTLDFDGVQVEFAQALTALRRIARQTMFAPESRDAPVQVLGPLEAAGSTFDAIWFLRAEELSWPMDTGSNPLLPWRLQRELGMPATDIERDSEHARRMTERIARSAPILVFSYAREDRRGPPETVSCVVGPAVGRGRCESARRRV